MRVHFERTGGFAAPAMKRSCTVDTTALPESEANELESLLQSADISQLASSKSGESPQRDAFRYKLTVEHEGGTHTVDLLEADVPEKVRPLLNWLKKRATASGRS